MQGHILVILLLPSYPFFRPRYSDAIFLSIFSSFLQAFVEDGEIQRVESHSCGGGGVLKAIPAGVLGRKLSPGHEMLSTMNEFISKVESSG